MENNCLNIYCDGGARGNPGPAAIGVVIKSCDGKNIIASFGKTIGVATNNTAEYEAVVAAFLFLGKNKIETTMINFFIDSTIVVNQLNHLFKINKKHLIKFVNKIKKLEKKTAPIVIYRLIPREQNRQADKLVNDALDKSPK